MGAYIEPLKMAAIFFPFIAFLISIPFILIQYHRYGAISFFKAFIIYSFVLYFICAYFLVILPLPKSSEVALLTTPRMQLIPFKFILDFVKHTCLDITNIHTYIKVFTQSCFFVPLYNIVLTLPFGMYLRYYFKCDLKKTILCSFLLSLFFELTQLSGLYFIYPRGYRLFDVDDLFLNTLGGCVGYLIANPIIKILPKLENVELKVKERGKNISGLRRSSMVCLDLVLFLMIDIFVSFFIKFKYMLAIIFMLYYIIIPIFLNCRTIGENYLNIKVVDYNNNRNIWRFILRNVFFVLLYIIIPLVIPFGVFKIKMGVVIREISGLIYLGIVFLLYSISGIKYLFTNKEMLYEKLSKTKIVSTI